MASDSSSTRDDTSPNFTPFRKFQEMFPNARRQLKVYEDALVQKVKDEVKLAYEHPAEACGVAVAAGFILLRRPRRFLIRNTFGRFTTEEEQIRKVKSLLKELDGSVEELKKETKNILTRTKHAEEDLSHGQTKIRAAGREIQRLTKSISKIETQAADLMDELRPIPGETALRLRAQLASMKSDLKDERLGLNQRIVKVTELGIRL